jgi:diguanylate cyclase (GGDEF)-like protein
MRQDGAMSANAFTVLWVGDAPKGTPGLAACTGPFVVAHAADWGDARLHDAVVISAADAAAVQALLSRADLTQAAFESAVVVCAASPHDDEATVALLRMGIQDVVAWGDDEALARALRHAVERKRLERAARHAYATDLATGLPHQAQLLEHMTHLLALREREPAPMVLLVLRIEGLPAAAARLGAEAANVLRRKVAVRLRGGLRASDVVASIGPDAFGVLLGHVEAPSHGERVASKLVRSLQQPFQVAGQSASVALSVGMALYPEHGKDAESLLRRATAQAMSLATAGREGVAGPSARGPAKAANDDAT